MRLRQGRVGPAPSAGDGTATATDAAALARLLDRTLHRPTHDPALEGAAVWAHELRGEELACG